MPKDLENVYDILKLISETTKRLEKEKIIKDNSEAENFKKVVFYALDFSKVYHVTSVPTFASEQRIKSTPKKLFEFLEYLSMKNGATDEDRIELSKLSYSLGKKSVDVVNRIIRKDLGCGASLKTFKKIFPDLPLFEMMTCKSDIDKFIKLAKKEESDIFISAKKDGVRTWGKPGQYISRSGLSYNNFGMFDDELNILLEYLSGKFNVSRNNTYIDGEVTVRNGNFQDVMRNVRTIEDGNEANYIFNIFDIVLDNKNLKERMEMLEDAFSVHRFRKIRLLKHKLINVEKISTAILKKYMNSAVQKGEEGIVAKLVNSPYEFKEKSKYWLKMKPTETYDLLVVGKFKGQGRLKNTLGGLIVKYNDVEVKVGSGYSDEERNLFMNRPPKIIEVKCKGVTEDGSLREPIFVRSRDDKSSVTDEQDS